MAFLGIYEPGEIVRASVMCLEDGGKRDSGCTSPGAGLLGPYNATPDNITFVENDASSSPGTAGLWRVNYTVGAGDVAGLWTVILNLTNSNGTPGSTVIQFEVVGDGRGIDNTGANVVTALSNQAVIQAAVSNVNETVKNVNTSIIRNLSNDKGFFGIQFLDINTSIIRNLSNDKGFFQPLLDAVNNSLYNYMSAVNISILRNLSIGSVPSTLSSDGQTAVGLECAKQVHRQNMTADIFYNFSNNSMQLLQIKYNYTGLGILINETYSYNNESLLNLTNRSTSNG